MEEFKKMITEMYEMRRTGRFEDFMKKFTTQDCCFMSSMHDPVDCRGAINVFNQPQMKELWNSVHDVKLDDVKMMNDMAVLRTSFTCKMRSGERKGWSLMTMVKEGGMWKMRHCCNAFRCTDI
ncbi:unnamed protein product [Caenorhabditis auriculariae]|uniref:DUF4440 domain-containing protein n=2 Tax=Caenorhabditis auriculariae TaxID=2777116 RepID=A0A8S1HX48_9PELO|nr:unnamed protein product [Caenorhabditis auriculariae]